MTNRYWDRLLGVGEPLRIASYLGRADPSDCRVLLTARTLVIVYNPGVVLLSRVRTEPHRIEPHRINGINLLRRNPQPTASLASNRSDMFVFLFHGPAAGIIHTAKVSHPKS